MASRLLLLAALLQAACGREKSCRNGGCSSNDPLSGLSLMQQSSRRSSAEQDAEEELRGAAAQDPASEELAGRRERPQKNIILMMMDDQDLMLDVFEYMPHLRNLIVEEGTSFTQHRVPLSQCCPSRSSLMTGRHAHNLNVTAPRPPYGGFEKFAAFVPDSIAVKMQRLGYTTHYTGKFMAGYNADQPRVEGWTDWRPYLDPWVYDFNQTLMGVWPPEGTAPTLHWFKGVAHQNTAMACTVRDMLAQKQAEKQARNGYWYDPFFMFISPIVPHDETLFDIECEHPGGFVISVDPLVCAVTTPPTPLPRHAEMFSDVKIPRNSVFNPDDLQHSKTPAWMRALPKFNQTQENWLDYTYQQRLRSVQSFDELVHDMVQQLEEQQMLDDTYIIYTSDNGYHLGQWRLAPTKLTPYDIDNRVPLVIRGPGIEKGAQSLAPTSHLDFYGAFLNIAGAGGEVPDSIDGLPNFLESNEREFMLMEYWGGYVSQQPQEYPLPDGPWISLSTNGGQIAWSHVGITAHSDEYYFKYVYYCHGTAELYDLAADPWETNNLFPKIHKKKKVYRIADRLDALLYVLKTCSGPTCRDPLTAFSNAAVEAGLRAPTRFYQAVHYKYDAIFRDAPRPHFLKCSVGHFADNEPQRPYPIDNIFLEEPPPANASSDPSSNASLIASTSPVGDLLVPADGIGVLSNTPPNVEPACKVKRAEKSIDDEITRMHAETPPDVTDPDMAAAAESDGYVAPVTYKLTGMYFPPRMCKAVLKAGEFMGKVYVRNT